MVGRLNGDLANDLGNLAQRVLSFVHKNGGAQVPPPGAFDAADDAMLAQARGILDAVRHLLTATSNAPEFHRALEAVWSVVTGANAYVDKQAPWTLRKTDPARMNTVLYTLAETLRCVALVLQPFMPQAMEKLLDQLAVPADARDFASLDAKAALTPGTSLPAPQGIFPRFVEEKA